MIRSLGQYALNSPNNILDATHNKTEARPRRCVVLPTRGRKILVGLKAALEGAVIQLQLRFIASLLNWTTRDSFILGRGVVRSGLV